MRLRSLARSGGDKSWVISEGFTTRPVESLARRKHLIHGRQWEPSGENTLEVGFKVVADPDSPGQRVGLLVRDAVRALAGCRCVMGWLAACTGPRLGPQEDLRTRAVAPDKSHRQYRDGWLPGAGARRRSRRSMTT